MSINCYSTKCPKFCHTCGRKLERKNYFNGFNEQTGEVIVHTTVFCPVNVLKRVLQNHYKANFDEVGCEIIEYNIY